MDTKDKGTPHFRRAELVRDLQFLGDSRWREAARRDLKELSLDEEGLDRLSAAIKAVLRGR